MNVYVIYRFCDIDKVEKQIEKIKTLKNIRIFYFKPNNENSDLPEEQRRKIWHAKAKEKINNADMVCYFFNFDSTVGHSDNVKWEYDCATSLGKKVFIINVGEQSDFVDKLKNLSKDNNFVNSLFNYDYSEEEINPAPFSSEQGKDKLKEQSAYNVVEDELLLKDKKDLTDKNKKSYYDLLIKQYELMVNTSEQLMGRRQATCNLYVSVCTALVALVGSSFALKNMIAIGVIFICVGVLSIILSTNWLRALESYDKNNEGKFAVLNEIEKRLPANLFNSEYRYNKFKGIKSFSVREKKLPIAFVVLGALFIIVGVVFLTLFFYNVNIFPAEQ